MEKGGGLTYALGITILTCAFSLLSAAAIPEEFKIRQVTDDQNYPTTTAHGGSNHHLLGTPAEHRFKSFIQEYNKEYSTREEYIHRLGVFIKNLLKAAEHQALDPTAVHGVTQFSDLTSEEFEMMYMGVKGGDRISLLGEVGSHAPPMEVKDLPNSFDWREKGAVTEVKMQGTCGSCWAFSTTGSIEGANFIATGKLLNLSEQQLVDCDNTCDKKDKTACDSGCKGGLMTNAYKYLIEAGGVEEEDSYPYIGKRGECNFSPDKIAVGNYFFIIREGNDFSVPEAMEVDTGSSCFIEKLPVERYTPTTTRETKKPLETNKSPAAFVNHAAIAWHENRRKWVGEVSRKSERMPKDPIISWSTTYEELLSTTDPFSERIPLTEMVDFLVDIWHDEGLFD